MRNLSREYLETLSSIELIRLADEYGIDIPDDLSRQFIIGDLIQLGEELERAENAHDSIVLSDDDKTMNVDTLPQGYNETNVNVVMRNPVSLFVWWDLCEVLVDKVGDSEAFSLAVCFFEEKDCERPCETFEIRISSGDREQYVIIPAGRKFVRVDLICNLNGRQETLAFSQLLALPCPPKIVSMRPGERLDIPPIMEISGAAEMLREHYNEYRQLFY